MMLKCKIGIRQGKRLTDMHAFYINLAIANALDHWDIRLHYNLCYCSLYYRRSPAHCNKMQALFLLDKPSCSLALDMSDTPPPHEQACGAHDHVCHVVRPSPTRLEALRPGQHFHPAQV